MNIKNRLKKLQSQIIGNDSEFCGCQREWRTNVILPSLDGEAEDARETLPPEVCDHCRKPIEKRVIKPFDVESNIPKPE